MHSLSFLTALLALVPSTLSAAITGYHIIVARAAGELPGEGSSGDIASGIAAKVPNSDSVGLNYPALPILTNFSESAGVTQLRSDISSYVESNPKAKIVLIGYDQGAQVVGDVLGGAGTDASFPIEGLEAKAVKGVILLSDPAFVPGQPYDAGNATTVGTQPRSPASLKNLARFSKVTQSYCDEGDTVCASGNNSEVNRGYLTKYEDAAVNFVVGLYQK